MRNIISVVIFEYKSDLFSPIRTKISVSRLREKWRGKHILFAGVNVSGEPFTMMREENGKIDIFIQKILSLRVLMYGFCNMENQ